MGKAAVVEFEGTRYTLSLISWGILRRTMQGAAAKAMMGVPFVPGYELAVWQGAASTQILGLLCYFPDKQTAKEWFTKIEASIKEDAIAHVLIPGGVGIGLELAWLRKFDSGIAS